jgi:hypothetical protein
MADYKNSKGGKLGDSGAKHPKGDTGKLLHNGLNEQAPCTGAPKDYGMDNMSDVKNQKPMSTPRKGVTEKGKKFTIC